MLVSLNGRMLAVEKTLQQADPQQEGEEDQLTDNLQGASAVPAHRQRDDSTGSVDKHFKPLRESNVTSDRDAHRKRKRLE